jgi:hypothetical protein
VSGMDVFGGIEPTGNQIASGLVLSKEVRGDDDVSHGATPCLNRISAAALGEYSLFFLPRSSETL